MNYNSVTDQLGEEAKKAQEILKNQRNRDSSHLASNEKRLAIAKALPTAEAEELMYPMSDALDNYIVFSMRPRNKQKNKTREHRTRYALEKMGSTVLAVQCSCRDCWRIGLLVLSVTSSISGTFERPVEVVE